MMLFKTHTLTFYTPSQSQYDDAGNWIQGTPTSTNIEGSLQAVDRGTKTKLQQSGHRTEDARTFYTKTNISTLTPNNDRPYTLIEGRKFYVHDRESNVGFGLTADHYKIILVAESVLNGEGW